MEGIQGHAVVFETDVSGVFIHNRWGLPDVITTGIYDLIQANVPLQILPLCAEDMSGCGRCAKMTLFPNYIYIISSRFTIALKEN